MSVARNATLFPFRSAISDPLSSRLRVLFTPYQLQEIPHMQAAADTPICRYRPLETADENSNTRRIGPGRSRRLLAATRLRRPDGRAEHDRGFSPVVGPARSQPPRARSLP